MVMLLMLGTIYSGVQCQDCFELRISTFLSFSQFGYGCFLIVEKLSLQFLIRKMRVSVLMSFFGDNRTYPMIA